LEKVRGGVEEVPRISEAQVVSLVIVDGKFPGNTTQNTQIELNDKLRR
jgi:hypothetical protein